jgi:hypothetical protein
VARCSKENVRDLTPTLGFILSDYDSGWDKFKGNYSHTGYVNSDGQWYIEQETEVNEVPFADEAIWITAYRFAKGDTDYATNWTNRASLTYNYYDVVW